MYVLLFLISASCGVGVIGQLCIIPLHNPYVGALPSEAGL
jgi:hypothetical protein